MHTSPFVYSLFFEIWSERLLPRGKTLPRLALNLQSSTSQIAGITDVHHHTRYGIPTYFFKRKIFKFRIFIGKSPDF
jgi:hypothetical protein